VGFSVAIASTVGDFFSESILSSALVTGDCLFVEV